VGAPKFLQNFDPTVADVVRTKSKPEGIISNDYTQYYLNPNFALDVAKDEIKIES